MGRLVDIDARAIRTRQRRRGLDRDPKCD